MANATLGYEKDTSISKCEIATIQLNEAIVLFQAGKFLCSITLAGASEEILARLLNARGKLSVVENSFRAIQKLREHTGLSIMGNKSKNEIFNHWNFTRNTLKHHGKESDETITINLFDEAYWMIRRALSNAEKLNIPIHNKLDFENWIVANINLN